MQKIKKYFPYLYIVFLLITFLYVRDILSSDQIDVEDKREKEKVENVVPVKVTLEIFENGVLQQSYDKRMSSTNSFDDLLEEIRKDGLVYEKTDYIRGTEYEYVNRKSIPEGYMWKIYVGEVDFTYDTRSIKLENGARYKLSLEKK